MSRQANKIIRDWINRSDKMSRCEQRHKIIEKIKTTKNWDMLDEIENMLDENPKYIADYLMDFLEIRYVRSIRGHKYYIQRYYKGKWKH